MIPIKTPPNQQPFIHFANYLFFLNSTAERRTPLKETTTYLDRTILDTLVYELYLDDTIGSKLMPLVEPHLVDIKGMDEEEKLTAIGKMVERLKGDEKVQAEIEKIKSHEWVKVIEGDE